MEYCTVAWLPHYKKDKHLIKKVQRQFTKMLPKFKGVKYEEELQKLEVNTFKKEETGLISSFYTRCIPYFL